MNDEKSARTDPVMDQVRNRFTRSGMSLEELGTRMGYPRKSARKSAWQFVHQTNDPRLSMVRRFVQALGIKLSTLLKG